MFSKQVQDFLLPTIEFMAALLIFTLGLGLVMVLILFIVDVTQTKHAIRRNYPVIGHLRYFFERIGEFFRQYFFAQDREEMPFNRAQRSWAYRAAKNIDNTIAFGSSKDLRPTGTVLFVNCPFPTSSTDTLAPLTLTIGPYSKSPYTTDSLFNISAMSFGAISKPAVRALSRGANKLGCWMNTGEGGLSPYHLEGGADIVFQIGTAYYGIRDDNGDLSEKKLEAIAQHKQVKMFEIKMSQGAKPGKGGILPGAKVTAEIANIRGIPEGQDSISPNGHPGVSNIYELLDFIHRIKSITQKPVGFKAVIGAYGWLDNLFKEIQSRGIESAPDFITVDSADGGTGAAPMPLIDDMGLPLKESLPLVIDKLKQYGLRDRIKVISSGKLITPASAAWALCIGVDFITSARGFMFALGCIQALQCNKNTCPTGITTHRKKLQRGLDPDDKSERVYHYAKNMLKEIGIIAHSCGVNEPRQLQRYHARIVSANGLSIPLDELHPNIEYQPLVNDK